MSARACVRVSLDLVCPAARSEQRDPPFPPHVVQRDKGQTLSIILLSGSTPTGKITAWTCRPLTACHAWEDTSYLVREKFLITFALVSCYRLTFAQWLMCLFESKTEDWCFLMNQFILSMKCPSKAPRAHHRVLFFAKIQIYLVVC